MEGQSAADMFRIHLELLSSDLCPNMRVLYTHMIYAYAITHWFEFWLKLFTI